MNKNRIYLRTQEKCLLCGNNKFKIDVKTPLLTLLRCSNCNFNFVPKSKIKSYDIHNYYQGLNIKNLIAYYGTYRRKIFKNNWKTINKWRKEGRVLDIGSSFGWFLEAASKKWETIGLEPSLAIAKLSRKSGFKIIVKGEESLSKHNKKYDLITLWNVIEHLPNPRKTIVNIHNRLNKNGLIAISFPNKLGIYNRMAYWVCKISGGVISGPLHVLFQVQRSTPHIFYFSADDVKKILTSSKFRILKQESQPIVDLSNISLRMKLEFGEKNIIALFLAKIIMYFLYFTSRLLNMHDEIVIYASRED